MRGGAGQHHRPAAHVPRLPALPHQVLQGVRALAHARQGRRPAQGAQPRPPTDLLAPHRAQDYHGKNICEARLSVARRRDVGADRSLSPVTLRSLASAATR